MRQERNNTACIISWILTVACMCVIFYFSSCSATESSEQSGKMLDWLTSVFGDNLFTTFVVRKSAHILEFTGLSVLFNCAWYCSKHKRCLALSVICTSAYAITDEIHQIFVDGRSCEFRDWVIDTFGAILGAVVFLALLVIVEKTVKFCQQKADNKIEVEL